MIEQNDIFIFQLQESPHNSIKVAKLAICKETSPKHIPYVACEILEQIEEGNFNDWTKCSTDLHHLYSQNNYYRIHKSQIWYNIVESQIVKADITQENNTRSNDESFLVSLNGQAVSTLLSELDDFLYCKDLVLIKEKLVYNSDVTHGALNNTVDIYETRDEENLKNISHTREA
jgi:hypothetical protein